MSFINKDKKYKINDLKIGLSNKEKRNKINKNLILNCLYNEDSISKSITESENNFSNKQSKKNKRNISINNRYNSNTKKRYYTENSKEEEEKNIGRVYGNIEKVNFFKKSYPNKVRFDLKSNIFDNNTFSRLNKKPLTTKRKNSSSFESEENLNNEILYIKDYNEKNYKIKTDRKNYSKYDINYPNDHSKTINKKLLISKLKDLIHEIEDEKKNINGIRKNKIKDISHLLIGRTLKEKIPNIKNRMELNKYLINDFKENDSNIEYIKRSLKYQKISDNYEQSKSRQKTSNQNFFYNGLVPTNKDIEIKINNNNNSYNKTKKKTRTNYMSPKSMYSTYLSKMKKISPKKFNEDNNNPSINKENEYSKRGSISKHYFSSNFIMQYKNNLFDLSKKISSNKNLNLYYNTEEKEKEKPKKNNSYLKEQFTLEKPQRNSQKKITDIYSGTTFVRKGKTSLTNKQKRKIHKKRLVLYDKLILSNNMYNEQKKYFNQYLMNKRISRSKNFSQQMSNLAREREKELELCNSNNDEVGRLPKLKEESLLYEMKIKNLFKNSFNPMVNYREGDDDLDLDNLKKIKDSVKETEIKMFTSLKNEINPKYIKKKFNKTTIGKYHSTRGVYFGTK